MTSSERNERDNHCHQTTVKPRKLSEAVVGRYPRSWAGSPLECDPVLGRWANRSLSRYLHHPAEWHPVACTSRHYGLADRCDRRCRHLRPVGLVHQAPCPHLRHRRDHRAGAIVRDPIHPARSANADGCVHATHAHCCGSSGDLGSDPVCGCTSGLMQLGGRAQAVPPVLVLRSVLAVC